MVYAVCSQANRMEERVLVPTHTETLEMLCAQAGGNDRAVKLFGGCLQNVMSRVPPFLVGSSLPELYLEFPLTGDPFCDLTLLLGEVAPGCRIDSPIAAGTGPLLDFHSTVQANGLCAKDGDGVSFGFEVDCSSPDPVAAGVYFQPRERHELVHPFCKAAGNAAAADLYLAQSARMSPGWELSYLGMFGGREGSPLRVGGYVGAAEKKRCLDDPARIGRILQSAGFSAYDGQVLTQAARVMRFAPGNVDFQFDVLPDGRLGDAFALEVYFDCGSSAGARDSFTEGAGAQVVSQCREWGVADKRAEHMVDMAFMRAVPVKTTDGGQALFYFKIMPCWLKLRWVGGVLQPAKMYFFMMAGPISA